ncbi:hypothetical protein Tco_1342602 [Tanacetum coccineum]
MIKDEEAEDVDVNLYRSMIGSLMYLTTSRPDIMFAVCACARDSPFDWEAFSDSVYAGASLDRKSTTGGFQFLGKRLILWQCKKQTIVANSTTEAEYVAAANCCGQETASTSTSENEEMEITNTIDGRVKNITEASIRRHLKLKDADGIRLLPNTEIFEQFALMGLKKTAWEQFSSNIATAIICLTTNRTSNFSKMIFEGMLKNLDSSNMRRVSKGYTGVDIPLFPTMLTAPESSPSRIISSPSLSPQTHLSISQQPPTPPFMHIIHDAKEPATMPHDSSQPRVQLLGSDEGSLTLNELMVLCTTLSKKVEDLQNDLKQTKLTYGAAYTKLILRVKKLEHKVKASKSKRRVRVIIFDNEEDLEDSYKQGRIIDEIDQNPSISLIQDEGTSWIQDDADIQRNSVDTEILLDQEEPTKLVEDFGSGEKGEKEISTTGVSTTEAGLSTVIPEVSTTVENLVYIRRSAEKRKDKGKAIMKEDEYVQKKTKKQLEQERLSHKAGIRLQEQVNEEERQGLPGM